MSEPFNPTQKLVDITKLRRPIGRIIIEYDPNTGNIGFKAEGLTPIEEVGCAQWYINLRHAQVMEEAKKSVKVATPDQVPPRVS